MKSISVQDLHEKMQSKKLVIIDVRSPQEYAEGHIPGAKNIALQEIADYADDLKTKGDVYLHCRAGGRSTTACMILESKDLINVVNVIGGILAWEDAGLEVEKK